VCAPYHRQRGADLDLAAYDVDMAAVSEHPSPQPKSSAVGTAAAGTEGGTPPDMSACCGVRDRRQLRRSGAVIAEVLGECGATFYVKARSSRERPSA